MVVRHWMCTGQVTLILFKIFLLRWNYIKIIIFKYTITWHAVHVQCGATTVLISCKDFHHPKENSVLIKQLLFPKGPLAPASGNHQPAFCHWIYLFKIPYVTICLASVTSHDVSEVHLCCSMCHCINIYHVFFIHS